MGEKMMCPMMMMQMGDKMMADMKMMPMAMNQMTMMGDQMMMPCMMAMMMPMDDAMMSSMHMAPQMMMGEKKMAPCMMMPMGMEEKSMTMMMGMMNQKKMMPEQAMLPMSSKMLRCGCGAVEMELMGEPKMCAVCHCDDCQKASASACVANAFFDPSMVKVTKGEMVEFKLKTMPRMHCKGCHNFMYSNAMGMIAVNGNMYPGYKAPVHMNCRFGKMMSMMMGTGEHAMPIPEMIMPMPKPMAAAVPMAPSMPMEGKKMVSCCCGSIEMELMGEPKMRTVCHCDDCQKATGMACVATAFYDANMVKITKGKSDMTEFKLKSMPRMFCKNCHNYMSCETMGMVGVNGNMVPGFKPQMHIQCRYTKMKILDNVPKYFTTPVEFGGDGMICK